MNKLALIPILQTTDYGERRNEKTAYGRACSKIRGNATSGAKSRYPPSQSY